MKIIDKIVTSVTQPQQTSVMWHNPDTGEFKIFGGKGWEPAGGNPGSTGSSFSGGYPVVTVENDFNIEAQPNIFYHIKNNVDDTINISFNVNEFYATGKDGLIFFTCENFRNDEGDPEVLEYMYMSNVFGIELIADNSLQGFKYKSILSKELVNAFGVELNEDIVIYYSDYLSDGKDITVLIEGGEPVILKNVSIVSKEPYLGYIYTSDLNFPVDVKLPVCIIEDITNLYIGEDIPDGYNYAYFAMVYMMETIVFTKKPYQEDNNCIVIGGIAGSSPANINYEVVDNSNVENSDIIKEFVFNLKSPANIVLSHPVSWNNDNTPDFTQSGTYTLSILNGVGCYTFT